MYNEINTNQLKQAGQYVLSDVVLTSFQSSEGRNEPKKISIRSLVTEINIYESLNNKVLSGNIVVTDAQNIPNHFPLTGFEQIEFKLFTPGTSRAFDFTAETGHPMHVYKISDRQGLNPRTQIYALHFTSKEMIRNEQVRVARAFEDSSDNSILSIVRSELDSNKTLTLEETKGVHKYVMPRIRPFEAIDMLAKEAVSKLHHTPGMLFFENSLGFQLKSYESLLASTNTVARPVVALYRPSPANIRDEMGNRNIIKEMQTVQGFSINSQYDTLKNLRNGIYNARAISHDLFNKTFKETDFDYATEYEKSFHTEHDGLGNKTDNKGILPLFNYKNDTTFSDYPDGTLYFFSDTKKIHNNAEAPEHHVNVPKRLSQKLAFESFNIGLDVPGFTGISCGDLIAFEMPAYEPVGADNPFDHDPYLSGRYLIKSIRHKVSTTDDYHSMNLECIKDAVKDPYPMENLDTLSSRENTDRLNVLQYELDELILKDKGEEV